MIKKTLTESVYPKNLVLSFYVCCVGNTS